jgi:predicted esterase
MGNATVKRTQPVSTEPEMKNMDKVLILHGWRTSGDILFMQTAAFRYHTQIEVVKVNAPWEAAGPPDKGIAEYYPKEAYYQWWDYHELNGEKVSYKGYEVSIEKMQAFLEEHGPFLGVLGFSQGATVATFLAEIQQKLQKKWFNFMILIGGVPPLPQYSANVIYVLLILLFLYYLHILIISLGPNHYSQSSSDWKRRSFQTLFRKTPGTLRSEPEESSLSRGGTQYSFH